LGTLPAGTVFTGGIGGGTEFDPVESGLLCGSPFELLMPLSELSAGGASGIFASSTPGRGLGASGGGIGRVADGASGMSSGFCCAAKVPVSRTISKPAVNPTLKNDSPSPSRTLIFVAIRNPLSFFLPRPCVAASAAFPLLEMPNLASLVHLTITAVYRID